MPRKNSKKRKRDIHDELPKSKRKRKVGFIAPGGDFTSVGERECKEQVSQLWKEIQRRLRARDENTRKKTISRSDLRDYEDKTGHIARQVNASEKQCEKTEKEISKMLMEQKKLASQQKKMKDEYKREFDSLNAEITQMRKADKKSQNMISYTHYQQTQQQQPPHVKNPKYDPSKLPNHLKPCLVILKKIRKHSNGWVFEKPVDLLRYKDYLEVVSRPMCLQKVEENLYTGVYSSIQMFGKDVKQIFINAKSYNPSTNQVHQWAAEQEAIFDAMFKHATQGRKPKEDLQTTLSREELRALQERIQDLLPVQLQQVSELVRKHQEQSNSDELQLDLDSLPVPVLRQLQKLVRKPKHARRNQRQRIKRQLEDLKHSKTPASFGLPPPPS